MLKLKHFGFIATFLATVLVVFFFREGNNSENDSQGRRIIAETGVVLENTKGQRVVAHNLDSFSSQSMWLSVPYEENGVKKSMKLYLMGTLTDPPFVATLADPQKEAASADVYQNGDMEIPTRKLFQFILKGKCNKEKLVVDAGTNLGYFSTYSAVMGCSVVSFEPQPRLLPIIRSSFTINNVADRTHLLNYIISEDESERLGITYVESMCWGCSQVSQAGPNEVSAGNRFVIDATRVDKHIGQDVLLFKVTWKVLK